MTDGTEKVRTTIEIVSVAAMCVVVARLMLGPDAMRRLTMRAAATSEALCMAQARGWAALADRSHTVYDKCRLVSTV